ncbi:hypothetical protein ILYODFUR_035871 [Ilyodon furcidens]|uniref:Uncharacterized protein n=1 Tax=Ilyodon furcidens TaxID=33524 RepID=A0ABV0UCI6_9TELE
MLQESVRRSEKDGSLTMLEELPVCREVRFCSTQNWIGSGISPTQTCNLDNQNQSDDCLITPRCGTRTEPLRSLERKERYSSRTSWSDTELEYGLGTSRTKDQLF